MNSYITSVIKLFQNYKRQGDRTFDQLSEEELLWRPNSASNSIAMIVQHMEGNMLSRWTNFMTEDGEKEWRKRDAEFDFTKISKSEMTEMWSRGWDCLFEALNSIKEKDLEKIIYIRNQGHTVLEAINRQLAHYSLHIGQILYIGKMLRGEEWQSLSIAKGGSEAFNKEKFSRERK
jgi:hypothetical protein